MTPRHFSQSRADLTTGPDDPRHLEPLDLAKVATADYARHEGEPVMLTPKLLDYVSRGPCDKAVDCNYIEDVLDRHYRLAGTGYGIAWDTRDKTARLVKL